jgi:hypothetical protein
VTHDLGEQNLTLLEQGKKKATTIAIEGGLPEGGAPGEVTTSITTEKDAGKITWSVGAWFKRKFQRGGTSAGVKGEIKF